MEGTLKDRGILSSTGIAYDPRGNSIETWNVIDNNVPCLVQQRSGEVSYSEDRQRYIPVLRGFFRRNQIITRGNKLVVETETYLVREIIEYRHNIHHKEAILERMEGHR